MSDRHAAARAYVELYAEQLERFRRIYPDTGPTVNAGGFDAGTLLAISDLLADADDLASFRSPAKDIFRDWPAMADVQTERWRQDAKWGKQNHEPETWLTILVEEVGELATAVLQERFAQYMYRYLQGMRTEAVHVAAVAVAMVEWIDRQQKGDGDDASEEPQKPVIVQARVISQQTRPPLVIEDE